MALKASFIGNARKLLGNHEAHEVEKAIFMAEQAAMGMVWNSMVLEKAAPEEIVENEEERRDAAKVVRIWLRNAGEWLDEFEKKIDMEDERQSKVN